ncbi:asparagine synthase-related protein [Nostoc sp. DedQUE07]|uniref:asparagine synthase-related protein n=1 Tax=Nostoc sp. DedQUE07 TaxID=3075392 RepID=UPI002AD48D92|nr:asparagine synthase-related protein [Nostoc sp. DedQUE07]MDZ8131906.1 asparagine synthase-related protein [Nostoc sp. DedQUE07]
MRISGSYNLKTSPKISSSDFQIQPTNFIDLEEIRLPISGPFALAEGKHGSCYIYSSYPSEIPLYFSVIKNEVHWGELKGKLPGNPERVKPGYLAHIKPGGYKLVPVQNQLPAPAIRQEKVFIKDAIAEYWELLLVAVQRRLATCPPGKIAVSCSGGVDSLLICQALMVLEIDFIPFTACTDYNSWDIQNAILVLEAMSGPKPVAVLIDNDFVISHAQEAMSLYEYLGPTDKYNQAAISYLAIAKAAEIAGCSAIFNGHGQDDVHGNIRSIYKELKNEDDSYKQAQMWRDERIRALKEMLYLWNDHKLFSSIFRHYGIHVRMPYFDWDLATWALSQPISIIPVDKTKPFVKKAANLLLPPGPWNHSTYASTGYTKGAGWENPKSKHLSDLVEELSRKFFNLQNSQ